MNAVSKYKEEKIFDSEFGFTIDVSPDSNCGLFRRYHVENNPVNFIDPSGLFEVVPVIKTIFWGAAIIEGIQIGVDLYYDNKIINIYDKYLDYLTNEINKTKSCEIDRYIILKTEYDRASVERGKFAAKKGTEWYSRLIKEIIAKARIRKE